jgi:hypothetical protein
MIARTLEDRWNKAGKWINGILFTVLFVGLWGVFIATVKGTDEQAIVYLPVPFLVLFLLWWIRWWAVRPNQFILEGESG